MSRKGPLSAAFCRTVKAPGRYTDGGRGANGLYLRVWRRTNGRVGKSWAQRIRINGRPTNLGLGRYPEVGLAAARAKALENRRAVAAGLDPRRGRRMPTFAEAAEKVIALHSESWKAGSELPAKWRQTLRDYANPTIGGKPVGDVTRADVLAILTPIWTSKPAAARQAHQRVGAILKWAVASGFLDHNPAGDAVIAALPSNRGTKHHRALPHSRVREILAMVRAADRFQPSSRLALELLILTACRTVEARGASWAEIDQGGRVWTIPAARMKARKAHRVPLSAAALDVLDRAKALRGRNDLVFPSRRTGRQVSTTALGDVLRWLGVDGTVHGFRTSFRTWAAEQRGVDREAEQALAHRPKGVEGVYQRSDLLEARRGLMEAWAEYVIP